MPPDTGVADTNAEPPPAPRGGGASSLIWWPEEPGEPSSPAPTVPLPPASAPPGTVGSLVDRVTREYLSAADDQPPAVRLAEDAAEDAAVWTLQLEGVAPEEESLISPGLILEIGLELARVALVSGAQVTVQRGAMGTDPAAHAAGSPVLIAPSVTRRATFDAVADSIVALHPDLWRRVTVELNVTGAVVDVPADAVAVEGMQYTGDDGPSGVDFDWLGAWPASATGQAVRVTSGTGPALLTYRARFPRPLAEADKVADLGVKAEWERIVVVGAAAQVIAGRDVDSATMRFVTEQLRAEAYPVGSSMRIRDGLLRYHALLLERAARSLQAEAPVRVHMAPVGRSW